MILMPLIQPTQSLLRTRARLRAWRCRRRWRLGRPGLRFCRRQRFYVSDDLQQLLFTNLTLERRHNWSKARHDLRLRIQDRFSQIAFVGQHALPAAQYDFAAIDAD